MSKLEWLNSSEELTSSENISLGSGPDLIGEVVKMCAEISAVAGSILEACNIYMCWSKILVAVRT